MANEQNLVPQGHKLTEEEASRGGKRSAEVRREKKKLKECMEMLLERQFQDDSDPTKIISGAEALAVKVFTQALNGDLRAFEIVRDTAGQKPVEEIVMTSEERETIEQIEKLVDNYDKESSD